jgi:redox-sensitive bicupin YhaK (pirin superfamily)
MTTLHKADSRGYADHGWLKSYHTFSFANYHNSERIHFGVLRVLNDDFIEAGAGFGLHPHQNMEIISIPLEGSLEHKDSMGNTSIIRSGEIQVMSAGTGIQHSEYNPSKTECSKFLQIWIFPNKKNVEPRYQQQKIKLNTNEFTQILSPFPEDAGVWVHQNAWFHIGQFEENHSIDYTVNNSKNGVYIFVLEGEISINNTKCFHRDGIGIVGENTIKFNTENKGCKLLLIEIPMQP